MMPGSKNRPSKSPLKGDFFSPFKGELERVFILPSSMRMDAW
jgi:hypothetical protein